MAFVYLLTILSTLLEHHRIRRSGVTVLMGNRLIARGIIIGSPGAEDQVWNGSIEQIGFFSLARLFVTSGTGTIFVCVTTKICGSIPVAVVSPKRKITLWKQPRK